MSRRARLLKRGRERHPSHDRRNGICNRSTDGAVPPPPSWNCRTLMRASLLRSEAPDHDRMAACPSRSIRIKARPAAESCLDRRVRGGPVRVWADVARLLVQQPAPWGWPTRHHPAIDVPAERRRLFPVYVKARSPRLSPSHFAEPCWLPSWPFRSHFSLRGTSLVSA